MPISRKIISVNKPAVSITDTERNGMHSTKWISECEECEAVYTDNKEYLGKDLYNFPGPHSVMASSL